MYLSVVSVISSLTLIYLTLALLLNMTFDFFVVILNPILLFSFFMSFNISSSSSALFVIRTI